MAHKWIKGPKSQLADGGYMIEYRLEADNRLRVLTNKYPVDHANGEGTWLAVNYIAIWPGHTKTFYLLNLAKTFLESIYREDGNYDS